MTSQSRIFNKKKIHDQRRNRLMPMHQGYLLLIIFNLVYLSIYSQEKINGISFVASDDPVQEKNLMPVKRLGANYASVMPFGFSKSLSTPELIFDNDRQWFGERVDGARQYIQELHKQGIRVMLKPQIWVWNGEFTGDIKMQSEVDWKIFESHYQDFILCFAQLAQEQGVEIFCLGTELEEFVLARPLFWDTLITKTKTIYKGKLTYAANWDEFENTPFWHRLDFIGVDAYFPLSDSKNPIKKELLSGWDKWKIKLKSIHLQCNKPILFTEYGYRSMDYSAKKPWLVDRNLEEVNLEAQALAYEVVFEHLWTENWLAGGFLWKWFIDYQASGGVNDNRFTPQNKPAEQIIRYFFNSMTKE